MVIIVWYAINDDKSSPVPGLSVRLPELCDKSFNGAYQEIFLEIKRHLLDMARTELPSRLRDRYTKIKSRLSAMFRSGE
jgi:hypothetical protein